MPAIIPPVPQDEQWGDDIVTGWATAVRGAINAPPFYALSTDPGFANVQNGTWSVWLNTTSGALKIWANQAGVMKSVTLT